MANLDEILWNDEEQLSDEEMLKYLDSSTSVSEKQAIEQKLQNQAFEKDAIDGLKQIDEQNRLGYVVQLQKQLRQQLHARKRRRTKKILHWRWIVLAIVLLLFTCIAGFILVHLFSGRGISL